MIGDPLIILEKHRENVKLIDSRLNGDNKFIIGIYGGSGTGKSETALLLQQKLYERGRTSLMISLDDYYLIHPMDRFVWRKKNGIDSVGTEEINWEDIRRICYDFENNRTITYRRTHKYCPEIENGQIESKHINYLIIEGLYVGLLKKFNFGDLFVYLEGTPKQTLEFRKLRGKEDEENKYRQDIVQKEFNVVCQLKRYSDLVITYDN